VYLPTTNFGSGIPDLDVTRIFSLLMVFVFAIELIIYRRLELNRWVFILSSFVIIKCASPCWSKWYAYDRHVVQALLDNTIMPFLVAVVALSVFQSKENIQKYMKNVIISASILSGIAFYQLAFKLYGAGDMRSSGTMNNPNLLAVYLVICIPCVLYCIEEKLISRITGWFVQCVIVAGVISTVSRKGIITMVLSYLIYFLFMKQHKKVIIYALLFTILAVSLSGYAIVASRFSEKILTNNVQGKWAMTVAGFKMFQEKPFFGNGYEGYYQRFGEFFRFAWRQKYDAHNEFITALANYGIIGFTPFILIFLYPLNYARKILKQYRRGQLSSRFQKNMSVICISTVIPFIFNASYAGTLFSQVVVVYIFYVHISFVFFSDENKYYRNTVIR
jgi:O-antigen ligase